MRLYPRDGQAALVHDGVSYAPGADGGFDFPEEAGQRLHAFHGPGGPQWEDQYERQARIAREADEARRDPERMYEAAGDAKRQIAELTAQLSALTAQLAAAHAAQRPAPPAAPAAPARPRKAASAGT